MDWAQPPLRRGLILSNRSLLFNRSPIWKDLAIGPHRKLPVELQSWLTETGSLTKRLRAVYGRKFGVKVLFNRWQPAAIDECRLLGLVPARYQLIREVLLHADGQPLVLARTVIPGPTIQIAHRNLSHLGNRPLGEVIFSFPDLERRRRQFSRAETTIWNSKLRTDIGLDSAIWGRRTVYAIHHHPLLVAEFFLPELLR